MDKGLGSEERQGTLKQRTTAGSSAFNIGEATHNRSRDDDRHIDFLSHAVNTMTISSATASALSNNDETKKIVISVWRKSNLLVDPRKERDTNGTPQDHFSTSSSSSLPSLLRVTVKDPLKDLFCSQEEIEETGRSFLDSCAKSASVWIALKFPRSALMPKEVSISRGIASLQPGKWINDEVVNAFCGGLLARVCSGLMEGEREECRGSGQQEEEEEEESQVKGGRGRGVIMGQVIFLSSFFLEALLNPSTPSRVASRFISAKALPHLFYYRMIALPWNRGGNHWALIVIDLAPWNQQQQQQQDKNHLNMMNLKYRSHSKLSDDDAEDVGIKKSKEVIEQKKQELLPHLSTAGALTITVYDALYSPESSGSSISSKSKSDEDSTATVTSICLKILEAFGTEASSRLSSFPATPASDSRYRNEPTAHHHAYAFAKMRVLSSIVGGTFLPNSSDKRFSEEGDHNSGTSPSYYLTLGKLLPLSSPSREENADSSFSIRGSIPGGQIPKQTNGVDCGPLMLSIASCLATWPYRKQEVEQETAAMLQDTKASGGVIPAAESSEVGGGGGREGSGMERSMKTEEEENFLLHPSPVVTYPPLFPCRTKMENLTAIEGGTIVRLRKEIENSLRGDCLTDELFHLLH